MAQNYYNVSEAAQVLGTSEENVRQMQERRELHGYRDGADWKFKTEDVDRLAAQRKAQPAADEDQDDVLTSEVELGQSANLGASGTVIGLDEAGRKPGGDVQFSDSDLQLAGPESPAPPAKDSLDSKVTQFEELDLTLDEDLTLEDSSVVIGKDQKAPTTAPSGGQSSVLSDADQKKQEDDDLVIGGSGAGSGVTLGGDSGISLVDPADSGLSLEEPLIAGSGAGESLELGEDDMLSAADSAKGKPGVTPDDDFLLTPAEDAADLEDSESGSQVIALDTEGDETATMIGDRQGLGMAAMLEEDDSAQPSVDFGAAAPTAAEPLAPTPLGMTPVTLTEGATAMQPAAVLPEAPYTTLNIVSLAGCAILLTLCGMMMYELVRNLGSYNEPGSISGWLMDSLLGLF